MSVADKSAAYADSYESRLKNLADKILADKKFTYDTSKDPVYRNYARQYEKGARDAAADVLSDATALSGGYANSYAQTAAQQQYNKSMSSLGNVIPALYDAAYERYDKEKNYDLDRLNTASALDKSAYGKYRDTVEDSYNTRDYEFKKQLSDRDYLYQLARDAVMDDQSWRDYQLAMAKLFAN